MVEKSNSEMVSSENINYRPSAEIYVDNTYIGHFYLMDFSSFLFLRYNVIKVGINKHII